MINIATLLGLLDIPPSIIATEVAKMESVRIDRTASRVVLGSMTDFTHMAKAHFWDGDRLGKVIYMLNYCPCGPLGYAYPADKARELLGVRMSLPDDVNREKLAETALALLHLTSFRDGPHTRAWKGMDWDLLDLLFEKGWIYDPKGKAKSVVLTEEGERLSQELFARHFGTP